VLTPSLGMMMEAARTSETSVDNYFTRQHIPEDNSELHTRHRENLKSHIIETLLSLFLLLLFLATDFLSSLVLLLLSQW
jgi:hypothetical protein